MKSEKANERFSVGRTITRITIVAVFGALSFVCTAFLAIPYAGGGYFNFGDAVAFLIALLVGPLEGALVGMIGGAFGDLYAGYGSFLPWTILAKSLMAGSAGLLFRYLPLKKGKLFLSPFTGAILEIVVYFFAYLVNEGQAVWLSSAFDCIQAFGCAGIAIALYIPLKRTKITERL